MTLRKLLIPAVLSTALLGACDIDKKEDGELPSVDVDGGKLPKYDVDTADVSVGTKEVDVKVPDVDVSMEEKQVTVPDVDVDMPDDESEDAE